MIALHSRNTTTNSPRGYTLIEVLLALGLSGLLMVMVYASMQYYWQLETSGKIDMERGQLARTIVRRMEMDIRSITYKAPQQTTADSGEQAADEGAGNTQSGSSTSTTPQSGSIDVVEEQSTTISDVHLIGTAQQLEMIVLRPTRNRTGSYEDALFASRESDRRKVGYLFSASGPAGVPGLYYRNADQLIEYSMELQGSSVDPLSQYELLVPELANLQFQYLDGTSNSWVDAWNSRDMAGLPRAIKITFQFLPASASSSNRLRQSHTSPSTEVFQTVVQLPLSEVPLEL